MNHLGFGVLAGANLTPSAEEFRFADVCTF
jgi:hypothetical protein